MRIGLIARADQTGLGHQTLEFYRAMRPAKTLCIDLTGINRQMGKETQYHQDWYPDATHTPFPLKAHVIEEWLKDLDVVFTCETPYNHHLFDVARERGIRTVRQFNYEFLDYLHDPTLPKPDLLLAPSKWMWHTLRAKCKGWGVRLDYLPVPVATDRFKPKVRAKAKRFIHIAGHPTAGDRNGTEIVRNAMPLVKSDAEVVIYEADHAKEYWELFDGDVLLLPRTYGGLSLQLQESQAAGMVPMIGKHDPYAEEAVGIQVASEKGESLQTRPGVNIERNCVDPKELAKAIDTLYDMDISLLSQYSVDWADAHSWESLKPAYESLLRSVCEQ